mmetsp:Transcript_14779/g.22298  ORF Transcript_14779/g.22298 Transcript_14779/m.22298 type:complete len:259 (-) Transcript_14779:3-779(-)
MKVLYLLYLVFGQCPLVRSHDEWFNPILLDSLDSSLYLRTIWRNLCKNPEVDGVRCQPSTLDQQPALKIGAIFRSAREEGKESERNMPSAQELQLLKSVRLLRIVSEYNTSSRYFGLISNLKGEDSSVPPGLYFQARESRIGNHDKSGTALIQTLFYVPQTVLYYPGTPSLISLGSFVEDWRPAHNLNVISFMQNNTRHLVGIGGVNIRGNTFSEMDAYQTTSLANLLSGVWRHIPRNELRQSSTLLTDNRKIAFEVV